MTTPPHRRIVKRESIPMTSSQRPGFDPPDIYANVREIKGRLTTLEERAGGHKSQVKSTLAEARQSARREASCD
jgi:hypothetical protein